MAGQSYQANDVVYVEPNEVAEYVAKREGKIKDNGDIKNGIAWNPEDLQYSIDLQVITPSRSDCGQKNYEITEKVNTTVVNNNSSAVGRYVSFLGGENLNGGDYLTTNYTNITYQEINGNGVSGKETLGIKNIEINFDSHFFPVVKIDFTDVRGSALFGPAENEYQTNRVKDLERMDEEAIAKAKEEGKNPNTVETYVKNDPNAQKYINASAENVSKSFFKALFHFPYPKFLLSVKGYYGDKVTFILSVSDFKTSFNPSTGNFDVSVSFIGYMYGLYTDIPMNLVMVSPYFNESYWNANTKQGGPFRFIENGQEGSEIIKFMEFLKKYDELLGGNGCQDANINDPLNNYSELVGQRAKLSELQELCQKFLNETFNFDKPYTIKGTHRYGCLFDKHTTITIGSDLFSKYLNKYNEYGSRYGTLRVSDPIINSYLSSNRTYGTNGPLATSKENSDETEDINIISENVNSFYKSLTGNNSKITYPQNINSSDDLKKYISKTKTYTGQSYYIVLGYGAYLDCLKNEINRLDEEIESKKNSANENIKKYLEASFGFTLSIENVFRMIFAHIDTFIDSYNKRLTTISQENKNHERIPQNFGLTTKNSDITDANINSNNIPPFFAFKENKEVVYPGKDSAPDLMRNCEEIKYVNTIYNCVEDFGKRLGEMITSIDSKSQTTDNSYVPSVLSDLKKNINPYIGVRNELNDLMYALYARIVSLMTMLPDDKNGSKNITLLKKLIDNEVNNLYNAHPNLRNSDLVSMESYVYDNLIKYYSDKKGNGLPYPVYQKCVVDKCSPERLLNKNKIMYFEASSNGESTKYTTDAADRSFQFVCGDEFNGEIMKQMAELYDGEYDILSKNKDLYDTVNNNDTNMFVMCDKEGSDPNLVSSYEDDKKYKYTEPSSLDLYNSVDNKIIGISDDKLYVNYLGGYDREYTEDEKNWFRKNFNFLVELVSLIDSDVKMVKENIYAITKEQGEAKMRPLISYQTNIKARALIFLASMSNLYTDYETYMEKIFKNDDTHMIMAPTALLTYVGGLLYYGGYINETGMYSTSNDAIKKSCKFNFGGSIGEKELFLTFPNWNEYFEKGKEGWRLKVGSIINDDGALFRDNPYNNGYLSDIATNQKDLAKTLIGYFLKFVERYSGEFAPQLNTKNLIGYIKDNVFYFNKSKEIVKTLANFYKETICLVYKKNYLTGYSEKYINDLCDTLFPYAKTKLLEKYNDEVDIAKNIESKNAEARDGQSKEIKFAMYYTLKNLYDKWLCTYTKDKFKLKTVTMDKLATKERYLEGKPSNGQDANTEYNSFLFVDSLMRDISSTCLVNPQVLYELIKAYTIGIDNKMGKNNSVFEFMNEIAQKTKLLFVSLPVYSNYYNIDTIKNIFTPNFQYGNNASTYDRGYGNTYLLVYTGEASSKLNDGGDYQDDGIVLDILGDNAEIHPSSLNGDKTKMVIPAFGVTYAKQNQTYFKSINVNMDNPKVTDYSISNLLQLSYGVARGTDITSIGIGQDIYSIYSNRSYTCTIEMLGCANIMPMMYFSLNSIPMFRGLYMIINVSHSISAGVMTTKFTGVRLSKNQISHVDISFDYQSIYKGIQSTVDNTVNTTNLKKIDYLGGTNNSYGFSKCYPDGIDGFPNVDTTGNKNKMQEKIKSVDIKVHKTQNQDGTLTVQVNEGIADSLKNAFDEIYNSKMPNGEKICIKSIGGYCWRQVKDTNGKGTGKMSNHSYGIAFDINASNTDFLEGTNGYMKRGKYDSDTAHEYYKKDTPTQFRDWSHPAVQILNKHGFGWGIYRDRYDWMHFSAATSIRDGHLIGN